METTVFLSKVIGFTLFIVGAAIILRRRYFLPVFAAFGEQRLVRAVVSMIELVAGLSLVVHNVWTPLPAAIILLLPDALVGRLIGTFNAEGWYIVGGVLATGAGLYLVGFGFAWW